MTLIAHTRDWGQLSTRVLKHTRLEITVELPGSKYKTLARIMGFTIFPPYKISSLKFQHKEVLLKLEARYTSAISSTLH